MYYMCVPEGLHTAFSVTLAPAKPGNVAPFKGVEVDILDDATGKCDGHTSDMIWMCSPPQSIVAQLKRNAE